MTSTLSRSQNTPADHGTARRSLSIGKPIEDSAVHRTRSQLDFPDHASVHLEPPGYYIPLWGNKTSLLQESRCLNTKIIQDKDVEVPEVNVKVSEVDVQGVVDFIEARIHQGVDAAHTHTVPIVKPLGAAHQGLCQSFISGV